MHHHAFLVSLLPLVAAHGFLASPPARHPSTAYRAACGEQPFYQQSSDINGNIQGIQQVVGSDKTDACNLWLCKGFQFDDNKSNVQSYSLGQTIDIRATIAAPHTGYANVSVVKTSTNTMIGNPLIEFQNYASNNGVAANNSAFSVTLPDSLGGECTTAGDCVLQWFWDAPDIDQTYEACVDFTVSESGSSGSAPSSSAAASSAAAISATETSTAVEVTVTTPAVTTTTAITSTDAAPATTTTAVPDNTGGDDEECPADNGEDDEDDEGEEDEECPADDGEDDEDDEGEEDEECPADDGEGDDETAATTTFGAKDLSTSVAATVPPTSIVTLVLTSTITTERVVTVTAAATACN